MNVPPHNTTCWQIAVHGSVVNITAWKENCAHQNILCMGLLCIFHNSVFGWDETLTRLLTTIFCNHISDRLSLYFYSNQCRTCSQLEKNVILLLLIFSVWQNHYGVCLGAVFETGSCQRSSHCVQETCNRCNVTNKWFKKKWCIKKLLTKLNFY